MHTDVCINSKTCKYLNKNLLKPKKDTHLAPFQCKLTFFRLDFLKRRYRIGEAAALNDNNIFINILYIDEIDIKKVMYDKVRKLVYGLILLSLLSDLYFSV